MCKIIDHGIMCAMKKLLLLTGTAVMLTPLMSSADGYQFIISGDPVAAETADSRESASIGTALVTRTGTSPTAVASLEARYRTIDESAGIALRSDEARGMAIIVR